MGEKRGGGGGPGIEIPLTTDAVGTTETISRVGPLMARLQILGRKPYLPKRDTEEECSDLVSKRQGGRDGTAGGRHRRLSYKEEEGVRVGGRKYLLGSSLISVAGNRGIGAGCIANGGVAVLQRKKASWALRGIRPRSLCFSPGGSLAASLPCPKATQKRRPRFRVSTFKTENAETYYGWCRRQKHGASNRHTSGGG